MAAAATAASVAATPDAAAAGSVSFVAFVAWVLAGRAWDRPAAHLPVLRVGYPLLIAACASATAAALSAMLELDGMPTRDWLLVLGAAGAVSMLARGTGTARDRARPARIAFIGTADAARRLADVIERADVSSYRLLGRVDVGGDSSGEVPVVADLAHLRDAILRERIDLLVVGSGVGRLTVFEALARCLDVPFRYTELSAFYEDVFGNVPTAEINAAWFAHLAAAEAHHTSPVAKRTLDVGLALAVGVVTLPLLACAVVLIRLGGGPALFVQQRVGESGRPFRLYKLRTMRVGSGDEPLWAQVGDPRVTRIGRVLRRTHVDELPQIWNVLRGDMSFVGPRPERPEFVEELTKEIAFYGQRHIVRPGITGWAQVRYTYGATTEDALQKLQFDLYYIKNLSIALDLFIIFETVKTVVLRKGA